jgi:hypothetical protein
MPFALEATAQISITLTPSNYNGYHIRSHLKIVFGSEPEEFFGQPRRETRA